MSFIPIASMHGLRRTSLAPFVEPISYPAPIHSRQLSQQMRPPTTLRSPIQRRRPSTSPSRWMGITRAMITATSWPSLRGSGARRAAAALRSKSVARPALFPRSHSTGHSMLRRPGENLDRFTLRLPEHVRREIVVTAAAGRLQRTTSCVAFPSSGEASSRRGYRVGEGSSRAGRSIRLGRSDRWPSFLARTLSSRFTSWGNGKRGGDGEGSFSFKKGDGEGSRSGSVKGRMPSVRAQFECLGGGVRPDGDHNPSDSQTVPLSRV
ncbi:hypothetical protein J5N97_002982 [Dioscorea zingiberensis]|uniref:Uncharacterized protein n=1 Tax=Dioscorea zingiberensis TaxID=325984 RepID=A0A9D5D3S8_9LILI|nr:hypothetical protein J5N97_002982 [Dioscorea zingiberensis]